MKQDGNDSELFAADDLLVNPDDLLPPVAKLEKYANSDIVFNRQVVVRNLLETLRLVHENTDDVARVINVLGSISEDYDPSVRTELMVQLPHIAAFCKEVKLNYIISQYLVPMLLSYLRDESNLVRKSSHSALMSILDQGLVDFTTQTEKIWPLILHMTDSMNPEDIRTESILLMSKLLILMGAEETFFDRLYALCADRSNNIRKACASTFGDICTAVGRELTEELLLPKFFTLCEDSAWCVRKACAENFMPVSCVVSREIRCKELTSLYMILLSDQSRWVRVTAYQALGPFISTFAEPDKTGLYYSKEGVLTVTDCDTATCENSHDELTCDDDDSDLINESNGNSDVVADHSSSDRTDSSKSCDNVVPLSCVASSHSPSDVPSISCQVGNYCTVIEVSSPASDVDTMQGSGEIVNNAFTSNSTQNSNQNTNLVSSGDTCEVDSCNKKSLCDTVSMNGFERDRLNQSHDDEFNKLWYEAAYGCEDGVTQDLCGKVLNGDIGSVNKKLFVNTKKLQNIKSSEEKHAFWSSITVNGVSLNRSIPLNGPISFEVIPSISCTNSNSNGINTSNHNSLADSGSETLLMANPHSNDVSGDIVQFSNSSPNDSSEASDISSVNEVENEDVLKCNEEKPSVKESAFNHFQYWRDPIPPLDMEEEINYYKNHCVGAINAYENIRIVKSEVTSEVKSDVADCYITFEDIFSNLKASETPENKGEPPPNTNIFTVHEQDIVPPELLLQYLNMIDSAWAQTIDAEIARHCAYSLPAVALTLGRKYWPCLRDTFDALTSDLQGFIMMWKVRRTVASALHQLAVILGPEITSKDLVPVFSRFIGDLDEVRIGILQHLFEFLRVLKPEERVQFLPNLSDFLVSNSDSDMNEKNWRLRLALAEQLVCIAELYEPQCVRDHMVPLALKLIKDKVCEVRLAAVRVMAAVMKRLRQHPTQTLSKAVLTELTDKFVHSPKWLHRQLYVYVCQEFIIENSLSADQFAEDALPQLLYLCWDRVPNVRLAIARCIVTVIWPLDTFSNPESPHRELLLETIHTLQSDTDADVRYYANMVSTHECSCLQNGQFNNSNQMV
nr:serine/threonine-protein phosphatase 4 regulatory subunit 1 [Parasteatoda tepidariorum]